MAQQLEVATLTFLAFPTLEGAMQLITFPASLDPESTGPPTDCLHPRFAQMLASNSDKQSHV